MMKKLVPSSGEVSAQCSEQATMLCKALLADAMIGFMAIRAAPTPEK